MKKTEKHINNDLLKIEDNHNKFVKYDTLRIGSGYYKYRNTKLDRIRFNNRSNAVDAIGLTCSRIMRLQQL